MNEVYLKTLAERYGIRGKDCDFPDDLSMIEWVYCNEASRAFDEEHEQ